MRTEMKALRVNQWLPVPYLKITVSLRHSNPIYTKI